MVPEYLQGRSRHYKVPSSRGGNKAKGELAPLKKNQTICEQTVGEERRQHTSGERIGEGEKKPELGKTPAETHTANRRRKLLRGRGKQTSPPRDSGEGVATKKTN